MQLLVYEYVSGGGFAGKPIQSSILSEGFGMLRTLISDFRAAGHLVTTVLDSRLAVLNPPIEASQIVPVSSSREAEAAVQEISKSVDAVYIIAPESGQTLQSFVTSMERAGVPSLNCRASAIGKVSDKAILLEYAKKRGLSTPATVIVSVLGGVEEIKQTIGGKLELPLVFKPLESVGCGGLSVVRTENQVGSAVAKIIRESSSEYFMVQELVHGPAVSVSLISTGDEALFISLNKQYVSLMPPEAISIYKGGLVPFNSSLKHEAFAAAEKIIKGFPGLRGYIGADLVLTENGPVVIEVNPRLTTSYIGVRKVVSFNLAQAIINSVLDRELPADTQSVGYAFFSKVNLPTPTTEALQKTYKMDELVSPPFSVSAYRTSHALLLSHRATLKETKAGFNEAKKRLRRISYQR